MILGALRTPTWFDHGIGLLLCLLQVGLLVLTSLGGELPASGHRWAGYLSPPRNVQTIVDAALDAGSSGLLLQVLSSRPEANPSVLLATLCVLGLSALGLGLLLWRVRKEVAG